MIHTRAYALTRACRGACGWKNTPDEFVIALPKPMFANGAHCGQNVTLWAEGKNASARVVDEVRLPSRRMSMRSGADGQQCEGCAGSDLDLSQGLFTHFAPTSQGVVHGSWAFATGDGNSGGKHGGH
jgi:hypothetical protein